MFKNYLVIAWRQMFKNRLYAAINILGLATGLTVYIFGTLLVDYERGYDTFFEDHDRIYTGSSLFSPDSGVGVNQNDGIFTAFAPFIEEDIPEVEAVARTVRREFLVSVGDKHFYEEIRFADPDFTRILDFEYIEGDLTALDDPQGVILSESTARKFFGEINVEGKTMLLDHEHPMHVAAVVKDLPANTHLRSSIVSSSLTFSITAPLAVLNAAEDYDLAGNWNNLSTGDMTYMLFPEGTSKEQVQNRLDGIYEAHMPDDQREFVTGIQVRKLDEANTVVWDMVGMPVLESVQLLALLVLIVAIVNYTNLATAQSMGRSREVGLRKTMGANRLQLLTQFMVESICIVSVSMLVAIALLEIAIPMFNESAGRDLQFDYLGTLPWLLATTVLVGVVAGGYPAYLITRATPISALKQSDSKSGSGGGLFRSAMLGLQFTISIFMLAMVIVVYAQNQRVMDSGDIYPRSQILTLKRLGLDSIRDRMGTLRNELMRIPGVSNVAYASQVPFEQSNSSFAVHPERDKEDDSWGLTQIIIDEYFLETYAIEPLAGRGLRNDLAEDVIEDGDITANIVVNEMAAGKLGFASPEAAIGQQFYDYPDEREQRTYTIVGVLPDQNYQGFHNQIKPMGFLNRPDSLFNASILIEADMPMHQVLREVESVWQDIVPEYPIQAEFLDESFNEVFSIFSLTTEVLTGFAALALLLSTIGLFGLAAFMAQSRTREIGIRKVMGASVPQIVRLLIWQFSKPVLWSLLLALPLAYFSSNMYLNFFADRIDATAAIVAASGILAIVFAWMIVAIHAIRIARANPIRALRYE